MHCGKNWFGYKGDWGSWVVEECPSETVISGVQLRGLSYQGIGQDDVGVTEMKFKCSRPGE